MSTEERKKQVPMKVSPRKRIREDENKDVDENILSTPQRLKGTLVYSIRA